MEEFTQCEKHHWDIVETSNNTPYKLYMDGGFVYSGTKKSCLIYIGCISLGLGKKEAEESAINSEE